MKTENRKAKRRTERYSLSEIIGTRRGGFYDGCAYEIRDLVPQGGSFRLRNGTLEAFTLDSDVKFSGSVNNNGSITGYISEANLLYELHGINDVGDASEARYVSDGEIDAASTFFFTSGGSTYMMTSGRMCKRNGTDFEDFEYLLEDNKPTGTTGPNKPAGTTAPDKNSDSNGQGVDIIKIVGFSVIGLLAAAVIAFCVFAAVMTAKAKKNKE